MPSQPATVPVASSATPEAAFLTPEIVAEWLVPLRVNTEFSVWPTIVESHEERRKRTVLVLVVPTAAVSSVTLVLAMMLTILAPMGMPRPKARSPTVRLAVLATVSTALPCVMVAVYESEAVVEPVSDVETLLASMTFCTPVTRTPSRLALLAAPVCTPSTSFTRKPLDALLVPAASFDPVLAALDSVAPVTLSCVVTVTVASSLPPVRRRIWLSAYPLPPALTVTAVMTPSMFSAELVACRSSSAFLLLAVDARSLALPVWVSGKRFLFPLKVAVAPAVVMLTPSLSPLLKTRECSVLLVPTVAARLCWISAGSTTARATENLVLCCSCTADTSWMPADDAPVLYPVALASMTCAVGRP